jgi:hypothetical protein
MTAPTLLLCLLFASPPATEAAAAEPAVDAGEPAVIQDNAFLLEEAYNQETGVVQHIFAFMRSTESREWLLAFTQEWPVGSQKHQFSYTVPLSGVRDGDDLDQGLGDLALNYRFQAVGSGDTRLAVSPRLSLLLPTGNSQRGRGAGGLGVQLALPASVVLADRLVSHWNLGASYTPRAKDVDGNRASVRSASLGVGLIWLAHPRFNVMLETLWTRAEGVTGPDRADWSTDFLLSPGVRWAHNFASGLQIVPGLAFTFGLGPSRGDNSLFLYLSFEHPFRKPAP